jgi:hypothetical protein
MKRAGLTQDGERHGLGRFDVDTRDELRSTLSRTGAWRAERRANKLDRNDVFRSTPVSERFGPNCSGLAERFAILWWLCGYKGDIACSSDEKYDHIALDCRDGTDVVKNCDSHG